MVHNDKKQEISTISDQEALYRLLAYARPYTFRLAFALIAAALFGMSAAAPTFVLRHTVDDIFLKNNQHLIVPFMGLFVFFFLLKALFMYLAAYCMHWISNRVINDFRKDLFTKILHFPMSFFQQQTTGQLMSCFLNDMHMVHNAASTAIKNGVRSFFEALFLAGFAFCQNWQLAVLILIIAPVLGFVIKTMSQRIKTTSKAIQQDIAVFSSFLQETFVGVRDVKINNAHAQQEARFDTYLRHWFNSAMKFVQAEALLPGLIEVIAMMSGAGIFYVACQQILHGSLTPGQLSAFVAALLLAYQPFRRVMNVYAEIQYGITAAVKIFTLMDMPQEIAGARMNSCGAITHLTFDLVTCGYTPDRAVLANVACTITQGERIGIVGHSGSGKSTLCDVVLGFIVPQAGVLRINGIDVTTLTLHSLRDQIGYVGQRSYLFNDSILNNVAYAHPNASYDAIVAACKAAHAHEFIVELEHGYQTFIGENGARLSGGQRQRIIIARALVKDPSLLIFDEATSALDSEAEEAIKTTIYELPRTKTVIIVSHRERLLAGVDRLLMVDNASVHEIMPTALQPTTTPLVEDC